MRQLVGPIVLHSGLLLAGLGLLWAIRIVPVLTVRRVLAAGGLAYLTGVAAVGQVCVLLLVLGVPFSLPTVGLVCAAFAAPLVVALRRRAPAAPASSASQPPVLGLEKWLAAATLTGFAVVLVVGLVSVGLQALPYDAWNLWGRRAKLFFLSEQLPLDVFQGLAYNLNGTIHPDYPIVLPLFESMHLRALGRFDASAIQVALWTFWGAFVWAACYLGGRVTRPLVWALVVPAAAVMVIGPLTSAYADVPVALYICVGVLVLGLWVETTSRSYLALAVIMLGGAAGFKNEGLTAAAAAFLAAGALVVLRRQWPRVRDLAIAGAAWAALAVIPWRLWTAAHDLRGDIPITSGFSPSFLADRTDRVRPSIAALYEQLINRTSIAVFVSFGIALAVARLGRRHHSPAAAFYLAVGVLYFTAIVWTYWISPLDLTFHIGNSVGRISVGFGFIAVAAILHLSGALHAEEREVELSPAAATTPNADGVDARHPTVTALQD